MKNGQQQVGIHIERREYARKVRIMGFRDEDVLPAAELGYTAKAAMIEISHDMLMDTSRRQAHGEIIKMDYKKKSQT